MNCSKEKTILVIDDDDTFRRRIGQAFRDRNHQVFEAANSKEAYAHLNRMSVSYVLLDLRLGQESGLSMLVKIKELSTSKVIVLTGYGTIATAVDAVKLGAVNYLTKPVDADTILAAFEKNTISRLETPHLAQVEWDHIQRVISDCKGNITRASKALGLHRRSLQRKLSKNPERLR